MRPGCCLRQPALPEKRREIQTQKRGRSWVSQFVEGLDSLDLLPSSAGHSPGSTVEGLNLLPASALLMTCRHLPGLMSMTPLRPNRSLWGPSRSPLGRCGGWRCRGSHGSSSPASRCSRVRQSPPGDDVETCSLPMGAMPFFSGRLSNFSVKSSS